MSKANERLELVVNGKTCIVGAPCTVATLLLDLNQATDYVAVAVNQECILRRDFLTTMLVNGDKIEILSPQAGG